MSDTDRNPGGTEPAGSDEVTLDKDLKADKADTADMVDKVDKVDEAVPADGETAPSAAERDTGKNTASTTETPADDTPAVTGDAQVSEDSEQAGDPAAAQPPDPADAEGARDDTSPAAPAEPSTDTAPAPLPADGDTATATTPDLTPLAPSEATAPQTSQAAPEPPEGTAAATTPDLTVIDPPEPAKPSAAKDADPAKDAEPAQDAEPADADGKTASPAGAASEPGEGDDGYSDDSSTKRDGDAEEAATAEQAVGVAESPADKPPAGKPKKARKGGMDKKQRKQRGKAARIGRRALFVLLGIVGLAVAAFGVAYLLTPVPSPQEEAVAQGPTFLYADGKTVIAKTGVNRDAVRLSKIPPGVRDAVIAAENRSFYEDPGVSVQGTLRAFWSTVSGEQLQGGSTITQQMVRNYYGGIGKERSISRKLKEIMVSLKVGREKSKDWILEQYLNTIYFGRDAYGVQAAARAYYGKDVSQLTPAEGAYLAAAIQQPSNFADPSGATRPYAESRWRAVVNNMVRDGAVTQADAARMTFPQPVKQKVTNILGGQKGYMVNVAKRELTERRGYTEDEINRSGLKITTTFDKELMDAAQQTVRGTLPKGMSKQIRTGLVSVDPATGQVLAFYGGRGYLEEALSSAFSDWAQAGSGFKPIVLATALDSGMSLNTYVDGSSPQYYNGAAIHNDGNRSYGTINLVTATQNSVNTAYVNLGQRVGLDKVTKMAEKMGIPRSQLTANGANKYPTFPLGTISMHPVQQAGVYATFAAEGVHHTPYVVKSVTDNQGKTTRFSEKGQRVFDQQVARDATFAMRRVVEAGTGQNAQLPDGRDVAGKTGTTDAGRAIWFNGFIPQLATSVSMFRSDGKPLVIPGYGVYGGQLPAQIWNSYVSRAVNVQGYAAKEFGSPSVSTGGYEGQPYGRQDNAPVTREPGLRPPVQQRPDRPSSRPPSDDTSEPATPPGGGDGGGDGTDPGGGDGGGTDPGGGDGGGGDGGVIPPRPDARG